MITLYSPQIERMEIMYFSVIGFMPEECVIKIKSKSYKLVLETPVSSLINHIFSVITYFWTPEGIINYIESTECFDR